nr:dehydrocurvularin biosynthesis regulator [Quercus suber]
MEIYRFSDAQAIKATVSLADQFRNKRNGKILRRTLLYDPGLYFIRPVDALCCVGDSRYRQGLSRRSQSDPTFRQLKKSSSPRTHQPSSGRAAFTSTIQSSLSHPTSLSSGDSTGEFGAMTSSSRSSNHDWSCNAELSTSTLLSDGRDVMILVMVYITQDIAATGHSVDLNATTTAFETGRRRKVRCIWPTSSPDICEFCKARHLRCEQQSVQPPAEHVARHTTRARLTHLEQNLSEIWSAVRRVEKHVGCEMSHAQLPSSIADSAPRTQTEIDCDETDSETSEELNVISAPTHLLRLFDNSLLDTQQDAETAKSDCSRQRPGPYNVEGSITLRALLPTRQEMLAITAQASPWLSLNDSLFPNLDGIRTSEDLIARYDELQDANEDVTAVAALLLSIALTVQQAPGDSLHAPDKGYADVAAFIKNVSDAVESTVISNDSRASTVAGIHITILFLRLQLSRAKVKGSWLLVRRVIALGELVGLPRARGTLAQYQPPQASELAICHELQHKAELWEAICTLDRVMSMMWSLPLGTATSRFSERPLLDSRGRVITQSFLYQLADIASSVQELETMSSSGRSLEDMSQVIMRADQELGALKGRPQKTWWTVGGAQTVVDALLQYWHQYITVRVHLQLALACEEAKNYHVAHFISCLTASQEVTRRYVSLRPQLPPGFFANWIIDLQAFTGACFLLLANHRASRSFSVSLLSIDRAATVTLTDRVVRTMTSLTGQNFAHQAAEALCSLNSLLQHPPTPQGRNISLRLPFVGRIRVSTKPNGLNTAMAKPSISPNHALDSGDQTSQDGEPASTSHSIDQLDSVTYSMEYLEDLAFLSNDDAAFEQFIQGFPE